MEQDDLIQRIGLVLEVQQGDTNVLLLELEVLLKIVRFVKENILVQIFVILDFEIFLRSEDVPGKYFNEVNILFKHVLETRHPVITL